MASAGTLDGHPYVALATLENSNEGQTQFISPGLSRWLRFLLYPLYAFLRSSRYFRAAPS